MTCLFVKNLLFDVRVWHDGTLNLATLFIVHNQAGSFVNVMCLSLLDSKFDKRQKKCELLSMCSRIMDVTSYCENNHIYKLPWAKTSSASSKKSEATSKGCMNLSSGISSWVMHAAVNCSLALLNWNPCFQRKKGIFKFMHIQWLQLRHSILPIQVKPSNFLASEIYWEENVIAKIYIQKSRDCPRNLDFCICSRYSLS